MSDLIHIKSLSGGRKFNFALSTGKEVENIENFTDGLLALATPRFEFRRIVVAPGEKIRSGSPIAVSSGFRQELQFSLPYDIEIKNVDYRNKLISFKKESDWHFFSGNFREKFISSLLWLEITDPVTGRAFDPFKMPSNVFISLFCTQPGGGKSFSGDIQEMSENAIEVFQELGWDEVRIHLLVNQSQIAGNPEFNEKVKVVVFPDIYPAPDPGILFSKKMIPYGFKDTAISHAQMDYVTLKKLHQLVGNEKFKDYTDVEVYNHKKVGTLHMPKWAVVNPFLEVSEKDRIICGGLLTGNEGCGEFTLQPHQRSITVIQNPESREMLQFLRPGFDRDSISPLVASFYVPKSPRKIHSGLRGEVRMCINCNYCSEICPAGLDPSILWKTSALASSLEEAQDLGLKRCMRCGLCSYVCPAKIELSTEIMRFQGVIRSEDQK
ncbi:4Fe-4S dicluster domain-containing protein [Myxococcota bacterium]|nr:4Fe-4S dicluster domain-containing protein [Myxococcota bacterium]MBU1380409.1 4Fe-4S dicluster domain-containing protein [Myxococcota bacterium]MBU1498659.1 4Fe-4S dicluster domain-containing protein [Myxococcota bacterium]